jgi:hypothetical protein
MVAAKLKGNVSAGMFLLVNMSPNEVRNMLEKQLNNTTRGIRAQWLSL